MQKLFAGTVGTVLQNETAETKMNSLKSENKTVFNPASITSADGSLTTARSGHTATRLDDGSVLIVGGDSGTFEIFNPALGASSRYGNLSAARSDHTAIKLSDGRVLIAGGTSNGTALASTEIYDPSTGKFTAGASLKNARSGQTATVLADGKIIFIGGDAKGTAEIFDPQSGKSKIVKGSMKTARSDHSALLMPNGKILIVGGKNENGDVSSAEIFDTNELTFDDETPFLHSARLRPSLHLLPDGKVQVIGGNDEGSMEIYTPAGNYFSGFAHVIPNRNAKSSSALKTNGAQGILENSTLSDATEAEAKVIKSKSVAALLNNGEAEDSLLNRSDYAIVRLPESNQILITGGKTGSGEILGSSLLLTDSEATVTTDALDYPPGSVVTISGTNWEPGETVKLEIVRDRIPTGDGDTETITLYATADADGNFANTEYSTTAEDAGAAFVLTATGLTSGRTAQTTFTDSPKILSVTPVDLIQNPDPVSQGNSAAYSFTVNRGSGSGSSGAFTACLQVLNLPAGATGTFSSGSTGFVAAEPNCSNGPAFSFASATGSRSGTLTITTTTSTPSGISNFTLRATTSLSNPQDFADNADELNVLASQAATTLAVNSATGTYGGTVNLTATLTQTSGGAGVSGKTINFSFNGNINAVTTNSNGVVTLSNVSLAGINAGAYPNYISASFAGDSNFLSSNGSNTLTVNKATPTATLQVNNSPTTYDGTAKSATVGITASSVPGSVANILTGGTANRTNAGTYAVTADFVPTDAANYSTLTGLSAGNFIINKANAVITVTPYNITYDGNPHTATGTAFGVESPSPADLNSLLNLNGTTHTNAGDYTTDSWTFAGNANYNATSGTVHDVINKATPTITWANPADITYGTALGATQLNASASTAGSFIYTPASGTVLNAGNAQNLHVDFTPTDTANYNNASKDVSINVLKANATINVSGYTGVYDGAAHGATGTATGVGGADLSAGLNFGATFTNVPGGTANWTFTGGANYNDANGSVAIVINKANASCTVNGYTGTYDGAAHGAAGACTGVLNEALAGLDLGASFTDAPGGTANWAFTDATGNYENQSGSANIVINKADAVCSISGYSGVYDAAAHGATGSCTGVGGVSNVLSGLNLGATYTDVPGGAASWAFTGGTNYKDQNGSVQITIAKADAAINVSGYTGVYDGAAHGASGSATGVGGANLNASLNLGATFINVPGGTANWTFTDVTGNYNNTSGTAAIVINKADATVTVTPYNVVFDGNPHTSTGSATGVNSESLSGLNLSATTHTNAGTYNGDAWTFTDVTGNYNDKSGTVDNSISKADASVSITPYSGVYDGNAHGLTGSATGVGGANLSAGLNFGATFTNVPGGTATWSFTGGTNYNDQSGTAPVTITKASAVINVTPYNVTYDGNPHTATATAVGVQGEDLSGLFNLSGTTHTAAGTYNGDAWSFAGNGNYNAAGGTVNDYIGKANPTISVNGYTGVYDAAAHGASGSATGVAGEALGGLNLGASFTNVPGGTASWAFTDVTGNYNNASGTAEIVITQRSLTITAQSNTKTYDGNANAAATPTVGGLQGSDTVTGLSETYDNRNAGTNKTLSVATYTVNDGNGGGNYAVSTVADTTSVINKAGLTITAVANSKVYNATTAAAAVPTVGGLQGSDTVTGLSETYDTKHVGTGKTLSVAAYTVNDGNGGNNYNVSTVTNVNGTITKAPLTITALTNSKVFDGTTAAAAVPNVGGLQGSDTVTGVSETYDTPFVGTGKTLSVATYTVNDGNGGGNYAVSTVANTTGVITQAGTTSSVTVTPNTQQYSDVVTFEATLSPAAILGSAPATGVTFFVGTQNMGTVALTAVGGVLKGTLNAALVEPTPFGTAPTGQMSPGNKTVTAVFGGVNPNFSVNPATTSLTVTPEDARANYTGAMFASTASATSSTATVTLSATIQDITATPDAAGDASFGDIRNATVKFVNRDASDAVLCTANVGLVNALDTKTGTATCNWSANIGASDSQSFTVGIVVGNYYTRNASTDNGVVTVSKPIGTNFITGGGYLLLTSSSGLKAGDTGTKNNFGFNVKYNKSGTNLQGNINTIVRRMESDGLHVYQIKGNSMTSLAVNPAAGCPNATATSPCTAVFNGKANIQDITNPLAPVAVDGNATLQVTMTDKGEPGAADMIAITVWNKSGGLWFSSNWATNKTTEKLLGGGNTVVH